MMRRCGFVTSGLVFAGFLLAGPGIARAQKSPGGGDATELAKASQNPVGDLVSLPFQFNFNTGGGLEDRTFFNLNFQPVMPIKITPDMNLIARTIVPVVSIPALKDCASAGSRTSRSSCSSRPRHPARLSGVSGPRFQCLRRRRTP